MPAPTGSANCRASLRAPDRARTTPPDILHRAGERGRLFLGQTGASEPARQRCGNRAGLGRQIDCASARFAAMASRVVSTSR